METETKHSTPPESLPGNDQPALSPKKKGPGLAGKLGLMFFTLLMLFVIIEVALRGKQTAFTLESDPNYDRQLYNYYANDARRNPYVRPGEAPGLKVAVVGDSFTNGAGIPYQDKYGVRLEALLNLNSNVAPAAVYIAAKGGTSTYDHYRYLKPLFDQHGDPDLLVLGICLNDTEDHQKNQVHNDWRLDSIPRPPKGLMGALCKVSKAASFVYNKKEVVRAMHAHEDYYQLLYQEDYMGYKKFVGHIDLIKKACDERGIKFFAMVWPLMGDLNPKTYPFHNIHEKVHKVLEDNEVPYVDLLPHFLGKNSTRLQAVPFVDGHPNEIGHRMASEILLRELLERELIPPQYAPDHQSGSVAAGYQSFYQKLNPTEQGKKEKAAGK